MTPAYLLYNTLISFAAPLAVGAAAARGRLKGHWRERFGFCPAVEDTGGQRIWMHAVSVGEIRVAAALAGALLNRKPDLNLWLTTSTNTGREAARAQMPPGCPVLTFPLDVYGSPSRALARLKPDMVIILETELWPNFLREAKSRGVKTMLANGRISARSFKGYSKVKHFFREVLDHFDLMAMIRPDDRNRILALGAHPERVLVAGNAKYDLLIEKAESKQVEKLKQSLNLNGRRALVAGSTRNGEEAILLEVFKRLKKDFPDLRLILAPRHIQRSREIEKLIKGHNLAYSKRSLPPDRTGPPPDVILVDVMGELFHLYGLADVAFCGASLIPLGGQNPLEPAVWAKPVIFGPFMEDFVDAQEILIACGAGHTARNAEDLYHRVKDLLDDPEQAAKSGQAGLRALENHQGAGQRLAGLALQLLNGDPVSNRGRQSAEDPADKA